MPEIGCYCGNGNYESFASEKDMKAYIAHLTSVECVKVAEDIRNDETVVKMCFDKLSDNQLRQVKAYCYEHDNIDATILCRNELCRRGLIERAYGGDFTIIDGNGKVICDSRADTEEAFESFEKQQVIKAYTDKEKAVAAAKKAHEPVLLFQEGGKYGDSLTEDEVFGIINDFEEIYPNTVIVLQQEAM